MSSEHYRVETLALYAVMPVDATLSRGVSIYRTTSSLFKSTRHFDDLIEALDNGLRRVATKA
jgi:O-acetylhomoserine (thiol)-lyase